MFPHFGSSLSFLRVPLEQLLQILIGLEKIVKGRTFTIYK